MKIFKNVCDQDFLDLIHDDLNIRLQGPTDLSSKGYDESLRIGIETDIVVLRVENHIASMMRKVLIKILPDIRLYDIKFTYQIMPYNAGISKHQDINKPFAATLYLNKVWDLNYGGLLVYEDKGLRAYCPAYNTLILNTEKTLHLVTPVTKAAPEYRYTLQCFGV